MKLRFLKLMLLLFILPLQMLAAELGVAGKQLAALPGVSNVETLKSTHFPEKYVFFIKQQLDAKDASKGYFEQRVVLCHRGFDRPTVLVTEGYNANYALREGYIEELSKLFDTNIITVEYRYFDKSMPKPCNWDYLTVENSLYDLHHVNQTLHAMYKGKWIATGISKGGQTTMFYRSYFPDDVDISVPYVAPLNKGVEDGRHEKFLQYQVSTKENRQKVLDFQLLLFKRKAALLPMFEKYCNDKKYVFNAPLAEIFDYSVFEYAFAFWQWGTPASQIPANSATTEVLFKHLTEISGPDYFATGQPTQAFFIQAARELGYYGYDIEPFKDLLFIRTSKDYLQRIMLPEGITIQFQPELYKKLTNFIATSDPRLIFVYGEYDPWTSVGITKLDGKKNMFVAIQPKGSHRARINTLPDSLRDKVIKTIKLWLEN